MRRFIVVLLVVLVSVWLGVQLAADPGYVLLTYRHWIVEMPLWVTLVILLLGFFLWSVFWWILRNTRILPQRWRRWLHRHRDQQAQEYTNQGLLALASGDWRVAEKKLVKAAHYNYNRPWLDYLAAAIASHEQRAFDRRDKYLLRAQKVTPTAEVAVGITQAQFLLQQQKFEHALATLQRLRQLAPRQSYVLRLLAQLYVSLQDWSKLVELLPDLRQYKALTTEDIALLEVQAYQGVLRNRVQQEGFAGLQAAWQPLSRLLRNNPKLLATYCQLSLGQNNAQETEELLRQAINKNWDTELVHCYGLIKSTKPERQLTSAEAWLPKHKNDAVLLRTLGQLSLSNHLWGKARSYLQTSIAILPCPETYQVLGKLLEQLNEREAALECYRTGLQQSVIIKNS